MRIRKNEKQASLWGMRIPDEDSSSASTMQVGPIKEVDPAEEAMLIETSPPSTCSSPPSSKKRSSSSTKANKVRFDESRNTFHQGANESPNRLFFCWNDIDDYMLFKKRALIAAKRVATGEKEHIHTLLGSYEFCCSVSVEAETRARNAIAKMNQRIPQDEEDTLTCGLGLERIYIKPMRLDIKERQKLMWTTIKEIQSKKNDVEDRSDAIRDALKGITLSSKLFALVKAQAVSDECSLMEGFTASAITS